MLVLLVLLLVAAGVFVRLGTWQLDRAVERSEQAAEREAAALAEAAPVRLDEVVEPQRSVTAQMVGRRVLVRGEYLVGADQYLVPEVAASGEPGALVVAALRVSEGGGTGAILPVVRGWVPGPAGEWVGELGPGGEVGVPTGTVDLVGSLAGSEAALAGAGEDGILGSISAGQLANLWGSPIYSGYLRLVSAEPGDSAVLRPAPAPAAPAGGLPLQNLAYAAQWWIFGVFAVAVWVRLVRDEAARLPDEASGALDEPRAVQDQA